MWLLLKFISQIVCKRKMHDVHFNYKIVNTLEVAFLKTCGLSCRKIVYISILYFRASSRGLRNPLHCQ